MRRSHEATLTVELPNNVVQPLLDHDRRDIQKRVNAATSNHQENKVRKSIPASGKTNKYSKFKTFDFFLKKKRTSEHKDSMAAAC